MMTAFGGKAFNDTKVNFGFPAGTSYKDLKPGRWIQIRWSDGPDIWGIILDHDERAPTFKGDRSIQVFYKRDDDTWSMNRITQEQIVQFGDMMKVRDPEDAGNRLI